MDYWTRMENYLKDRCNVEDVCRVSKNGRYDANRCLVLDLDGDGMPEGLALLWSEEESCYQLLNCYWEKEAGSDEEEYHFSKSVLTLEDTENAPNQVDSVILNCDDDVDLIIEMRRTDTAVCSIFLRYIRQFWNYIGIQEGTVDLWSIEDDVYRYDMDGMYRLIKPYETLDGVTASQYWQIDGGTLWSDYLIDENAMYWDLENTSQWYMKRPVVAYGVQDFMPLEQELVLLEGTSLHIIGVYERDGNAYYRVKTDTGEQGFILLNHPEKGTQAQVQLQSLPFEEVFSETEPEEAELVGDAYTSVLPVISAPGIVKLQENESYSAWGDFNGDGCYEKLCASYTKRSDVENATIQISIGTVSMMNTNVVAQGLHELQIVIADFDETDQWMEVGYGLVYNKNAQMEMYRYDGQNVRSLGFEDGLCFSGMPEFEQMLSDGGSTLPVKGSWTGGCDFQYSIFFNPQTGQVDQSTEIFLKFDEPVLCKSWEDTVLYDGMDESTELAISENEDLRLIGIVSVLCSCGIQLYYGYLELEDGTYAYTESMELYYDIVNCLDLTDTFGALAG